MCSLNHILHFVLGSKTIYRSKYANGVEIIRGVSYLWYSQLFFFLFWLKHVHAGRWVDGSIAIGRPAKWLLSVFSDPFAIVCSLTLRAGVCMLAMLGDTLLRPAPPSLWSVSARGHSFSSSACSEKSESRSVQAVVCSLAHHECSKLLYLIRCGCCSNRWCAHRSSPFFSSHWLLFTSCNVWHVLGVLRESEKVCPQGRFAPSLSATHAVIVTQSCSATLQSFKHYKSTSTIQCIGGN